MKGNRWKLQYFNVVEVALALAVITMTVTALCAWIPLGANAMKGIRNESQIEACADMVNTCMKGALSTGKTKAILPYTKTEAIAKWKTEDLWRTFQSSETRNWRTIVTDVDGNVILSQADGDGTGGTIFRFSSYTTVISDGNKCATLDFSAEVWTNISATELAARYRIPMVISWPATLPPARRSYRFFTNYIFCPKLF